MLRFIGEIILSEGNIYINKQVPCMMTSKTLETHETKQELELMGNGQSISYCKESQTLFLCDSFHWTVEQYSHKFASGLCLLQKVDLSDWLSNPTSIRIAAKMDAIFVGCDSGGGVGVFNRDFQLIKKFAEKTEMNFDHIAVDDETEDQVTAYTSSTNSGILTKWDYNSGAVMNTLAVTLPRDILVHNNKLHLICEMQSVECVAVLEKLSLEILSRIGVSGWSRLGGLCINEFHNICVTACCEINKTCCRSVYCFDDGGHLVNQVLLDFDGDAFVLDMVAVDNDLFFLTQELGPEFFLKQVSFS